MSFSSLKCKLPALGIPVVKGLPESQGCLVQYEKLVRSVGLLLSETKTDCRRLHEVRAAKAEGEDLHVADDVLAHPERYQSKVLRALIKSANLSMQLAEFASDFSGVVDKVMRNAVSGGNKQDMGMVFGSMCGRLATMKLNILGFAVHKLIGAGLFGMATLLSLFAVNLAKTKLFGQQALQTFQPSSFWEKPRVFQSVLGHSVNALVSVKEQMVEWACQKLRAHKLPCQWPLHWSRVSRYEHSPEKKRLFHSAYMWKHLGQYHGITRFLMATAHGLHALVNRFCISNDKHFACWIAKSKWSQTLFGRVLGERMANTLTTSVAFVVSLFTAHWVVGFAAVGAMACAVAIALMLVAKGTAYLEYKVFTNKYLQFDGPKCS